MNLSIISANNFKELLDNKILADDQLELETILKKREIMCDDKTVLNIMIHPTLRCNIECPYCFQKSYPKNDMTFSIANNIVGFISNYLKEYNLKCLKLVWSGGEPLLAMDKIEYIVSKINLILPQTVVFLMNLISNGILLSDETVKRLCKIGIKSMQVTIDGLYDEHNKRRSVKKQDSFSIVIKNIENILLNYSSIHINIRVNVDKSNFDKYLEITTFLKNRYKGKNYSVYPECVISCKKIDNKADDTATIMTQKDKLDFYMKLISHREIKLESLFTEPNQFCMKKSRNSFAVGPDGNIYDCELMVGKRNEACINIKDYHTLLRYIAQNKKIVGHRQSCKICSLLPLCNYGCAFKESKNDSDGYCHLFKGNEKDFIILYANLISNIPGKSIF
jgi:uncharacterized protein